MPAHASPERNLGTLAPCLLLDVSWAMALPRGEDKQNFVYSSDGTQVQMVQPDL